MDNNIGTLFSRKVLTVFAAASLAIVSGCTGGEEGRVEAKSTCGELSDIAATALAEITGGKRFPASSQADAKKFAEEFLATEGSDEEDSRVFCKIPNPKGDDFPSPEVKFTLSSEEEIPPPVEKGLAGESNFPVALRSVSDPRGSDIYFECHAPWTKGKGVSTVIRAELDYEKTSRAGLKTLKRNMDFLQYVARNVAGELECENHGGIQKRTEPW
ncbi:hypothetical protein [Streptomyces sp. SS8]